MSEENENEEAEIDEVGPNDLMIVVQKGTAYQPSERMAAALSELAEALAAEETAEVAGYAFEPAMSFDSGFASSEELSAIGCVRIGCLRGGGGGTSSGCTGEGGKIVIRCKGTYIASTSG